MREEHGFCILGKIWGRRIFILKFSVVFLVIYSKKGVGRG